MGSFRTVEFYKSYFDDFFSKLPHKVQDKFMWTFQLIEDVERVPNNYLKYIDEGIYEIRVRVGSNIFRVFCFFDQEKLIIAMNGFQKKTQRTPKREFYRALKIKAEYEKEK